jgi:anhydro-N-acetylmuramic acid kinase
MTGSERSTWTAVGLMSGTSMDGVDAALVELTYGPDGVHARPLAFETTPYPSDLADSLHRVASMTVDELARLNFAVGDVFAEAACKVIARGGAEPSVVDVIGSHGQTVSHQPRSLGGSGATMQIGESAVIAERTGIVTVADFRVNDVAAGGDGAPLVPYVDWLLLGGTERTLAAHNIGGISNVTVVTERLDDTWAFDTGPGNMPIDHAVRLETVGEHTYDRDGEMAARGDVSPALLDELMRTPYFDLAPPKSTGAAEFGATFVNEIRERYSGLSPEDFVATMTAFTARGIADAYERYVYPRSKIDEIVLSGGGVHNPVLRRHLDELLAPVPVTTSAKYGLDPDAKEAVAFAVLAVETMQLRPANVPQATGAARRVILGKIVTCT